MRSIWTIAAKLAIVVAVMAIAAEKPRPGRPSRRLAGDGEHVVQQAGLRQRAAAIVEHRMAGACRSGEFEDHVQEVRVCDLPHRGIAIDDQSLFARAAAMASKTVFVLIHRWNDRGDSIQSTDSFHA